jgi:hypothetical protein
MQWSKLKKRHESLLADAVKDHVQFHSTAYGTGDSISKSRAWITWDKEEIANFSTAKWWVKYRELTRQIRDINRVPHSWGKHRAHYSMIDEESKAILRKQGVYTRDGFIYSLLDYMELSIEEVLQSENPIVRALGMFDRRLGKRRLRRMQLDDTEHPLVKQFYQLRCEAEGIRIPETGNVRSA